MPCGWLIIYCMCACQCSVRPAKKRLACMPRCLRCCLWEWPPTCSCHIHSLCSQPTQWPRGEYRSKQLRFCLNFDQKSFKELISTHLVARVSSMTELPISVLNITLVLIHTKSFLLCPGLWSGFQRCQLMWAGWLEWRVMFTDRPGKEHQPIPKGDKWFSIQCKQYSGSVILCSITYVHLTSAHYF